MKNKNIKEVIIDTCPEFSSEIVLVVPFAYWAYLQGKLKKVITSKDMKPFYYFCDDVEEKYTERSIDNNRAGLTILAETYGMNGWIHGSPQNGLPGVGVLKYDMWSIPPYKEYYKNDEIKFKNPIIIISNQFNIEKNNFPSRYFDFLCLLRMFEYLTNAGYDVVYKCPRNTEFVIDENEMKTIYNKIEMRIKLESGDIINDIEFTQRFAKNIILLDDIVAKYPQYSYNEIQLKLFANAHGFISVSGGSGILTCFFQKPSIMYVTVAREVETGYWEKDTYLQKISNNNAIPVIDKRQDILDRGYHDYDKLLNKIKEVFK